MINYKRIIIGIVKSMIKKLKTHKRLALSITCDDARFNKSIVSIYSNYQKIFISLKLLFLQGTERIKGTQRIKGQRAPVFQKDLKRLAEFPSQENCHVIASNEPLLDHLCWFLG